jgi:hypothetical protein
MWKPRKPNRKGKNPNLVARLTSRLAGLAGLARGARLRAPRLAPVPVTTAQRRRTMRKRRGSGGSG